MDNRFEFTTQHCVQFLFTVSSQISSKYVCQSHDHFSRVGTNFETNLFFTGALERKEPTPLRAAPEKSLISPYTRVTDAPLQDRSEKKKNVDFLLQNSVGDFQSKKLEEMTHSAAYLS